MQHVDAFHAARLVALEAALRSLLAEAQDGTPFDAPDSLRVTFAAEGALDIEYLRAGRAVSGEGM